MQHLIESQSTALAAGNELVTHGFPLIAGEPIYVVFPNNARQGGKIVGSSPNILEIEVSGSVWRLAPVNPKDTLGAPGDTVQITWKIQP